METSSTKKALWTGRIISILAILFLLMDAIMKVFRAELAVQGTVELGYPESTVFAIGLILLICTALYAFPRTAFLGAILLTGYLGGAVATHVRLLNPLFSHILFPVYIGIFVWGGLLLRNNQLKELLFGKR